MIHVYSNSDNRLVDRLDGHNGGICCLKSSESGEWLLSGSDYGDGWIGVWV